MDLRRATRFPQAVLRHHNCIVQVHDARGLSSYSSFKRLPMVTPRSGGVATLCFFEAVTKLVPSAEADSVHPTFSLPPLPCRAFTYRRFARLGSTLSHRRCPTLSLVTTSFVTASFFAKGGPPVGSMDYSCPCGIGVWNPLPVAAKCVVGQRRACAIQMMCRIRNTGTANVVM